MDSITQATLGAAVGEAVLGPRVGNKAILWGAVAGTLPDLDILAYPLMDQIDRLGWHRGPSHAFFYLTLAAPVLGWAISRIHKKQSDWRGWTLMVYLAFITHILLDAFTVYGTQLFRPFSNWPVAFNNISIIDPLYTVPLLLGVIVALFLRRSSNVRRNIITGGLAVSTLYIGLTLAIKLHVNSVARASFETHNIVAEKYISTPTIFNSLLWRVTAKADEGFYVGYYSLLDSDNQISFSYLPQNDSLLAPLAGTDAVERLLWFSQGYYVVSEREGELRLADLRFGTIDAGGPDSQQFIFEWRLEHTPDNPERGSFTQVRFEGVEFGAAMNRLWQRILGD